MKNSLFHAKHLYWSLALAAIGFFLQTESISAQRQPPKKPLLFYGNITSIDTDRKTLTVGYKLPVSMDFTCGPNCTFIAVSKKSATLNDFKAGDVVRVRYTYFGETNLCSEVVQMPGASVEVGLQPLRTKDGFMWQEWKMGTGRRVGLTPCTIELKASDINRLTDSIMCTLDKAGYNGRREVVMIENADRSAGPHLAQGKTYTLNVKLSKKSTMKED